MGGFSSSTFQNNTKGDLQEFRHMTLRESRSVRAVDMFLQLTLSQLRREECIKSVVENPIALDTFVQFLSLKILQSKDNIFESLKIDIDGSMTLGNISNLLTNELKESFSSAAVLNGNIQTSQKLIQFVYEWFPKYLQSEYFNDWRVKEAWKVMFSSNESMSLECTLPELQIMDGEGSDKHIKTNAQFMGKGNFATVDAKIIDPITIIEKQKSIFSASGSLRVEADAAMLHIDADQIDPVSVIEQAVHSCDPIEVSRLLKSDGWLTVLITAAENLPIGISLSIVSRERPGYPVIYVNKHFEEKSGYKREDVIGEKFGFMQRSGSSLLPEGEESRDRLSTSLAMAEANVVALKSRRRNGTSFTTIVGLKPVVDKWLNYRYVIGIHLELPTVEKTETSLQLIKYLISTLPEIIN
eukprot:gene2106-4114_t